jgi:uncharacterized membrane protein
VTDLEQGGPANGDEPGAAGGAAAAGRGDLVFGDVIGEAWRRVSGNKATVWIALLILIAISLALSMLFNLLLGPAPTVDGVATMRSTAPLEQLITTFITTPVGIGLTLVGAAIASDAPAKPTSVLSWYHKVIPLILTTLLMYIMIFIGLVLLVLPGIYLAVSYCLALPLVADKSLGPWQALETSRKLVTPHWFTVFGLMLFASLLAVVSMVAFGIPLIWVMPAIVIGAGIVFRNLAGPEPATLRRVAGEA